MTGAIKEVIAPANFSKANHSFIIVHRTSSTPMKTEKELLKLRCMKQAM